MCICMSAVPVNGSYRQETQQPTLHEILSLTHKTKQKAKSCTRGWIYAHGDPVVMGSRSCRVCVWDAASSKYSKGDKLLLPVIGVYPIAYCRSHEQRTQEVSVITNQEDRHTLDSMCQNIINGYPPQPH